MTTLPDNTNGDYFYMRAVYVDKDNQLYTSIEAGAITRDPMKAYRRFRLAREQQMGRYGWPSDSHLDRRGQVFAYWRLDQKMSWRKAAAVARISAPERVCVLTSRVGWWHAELTLPDGVLIKINVPRGTSSEGS